MRSTESYLTYDQRRQYQNELKNLIFQTKMTNPLFVTIRMKQAPKGTPKLTLERAYVNNAKFLNYLHRCVLGNNWKRRFPNGLQRFVIIEDTASIGIHTHMIIDSPDNDISNFKEMACKAYQKTPYSGQPYKHFNDGELVNVKSVFSDGVIDYITKFRSKPNFDMAFDINNSYWASK